LAANISHDFRTPLTSLRGYTERLLRSGDRLDPAESRRTLDSILKSATQLQHLADQLAAIVQLDVANHSELHCEPFSIAELVQDVAAKFAPVAERSGIALRVANPETVPAVTGDIALVERAISNLVDNALDNTPSGGHIEIGLNGDGDAVRVRVSDTGRGIPADELARVTQRFFRTRESRSRGKSGSGLGLAITQEIVERHGSRLEIESRVGTGTVVSFKLSASSGTRVAASDSRIHLDAHS
jgi:two-component system OmpR family sensor kinase